jgi:hypothetical protein
MIKKTFKIIAVIFLIIIIIPIFSIIFLGFSSYRNEMLVEKCNQTDYKIKSLTPNTKYTLKNDPYGDRLKIETLDIETVSRAKGSITVALFMGYFDSCTIRQQVRYNITFNNQILTPINYTNSDPFNHNFFENLGFGSDGKLLDTTKEYNLEDMFINTFRIQNKNNLTLYTKIVADTLEYEDQIDDSPVFIVENNSATMIDIPSELFPFDSGNHKKYTDFKKNGDNLEITFTLSEDTSEDMIKVLEIAKIEANNYSGRRYVAETKKIMLKEEEIRLWKDGLHTFCFKIVGGLNPHYSLCNEDRQEFSKILNQN